MKHIFFYLLFFIPLLLHTQPSSFGTPTDKSEPILTLNTGMHTAMINRISINSRGRYLLTASDDKTAKLWDIASGGLLRTFRPPIGEGNEGMLKAGVLSPDGRTVAVGGFTDYTRESKHSIYLFDANTGAMLRRIGGLPNVIRDLEFSPDGRFLVAALGEDGIRVYRNNDGGLYAQDSDYGDRCYNVVFDPWGSRLATVCDDGYLRLYDADFKLLKKSKTTGGSQPFSLAFSPNGRLLAVGYEDSPMVQVLDASVLAFRYTVDMTENTENGGLDILAFSIDGSQLVAGGGYQKYNNGKWWQQIRQWNEQGKGTYTDLDAGQNSIMDIKALPSGGFVYASANPDWGSIDATGRRVRYVGPDVLSYASSDKTHFRFGTGGVEVSVTPLDDLPLRFEVLGRQLLESASTSPAPTTERNDLRITNLDGNAAPKLNGKSLSLLQKREQCYSAAIATGGTGIVLGTSWNLYCADASGSLRWEQPIPEVAYCVNIDPTNQVVVAGLGDGTIRWYRFRNGKPLLTLYIHPDRKRWVLWTPSGYFDCAPGAEDFLGWHVNQGLDREAAYYPLSKFRDRFYRPDVIDRILETYDEDLALQDADAARGKTSSRATLLDELPPTARILGPAEGTEISSTKIPLAYSLQSPNSEPITGLRILVDGRPIATGRGFKPLGQRLEEPIEVPAANCTVSVVAENRFGASEPATLRLFWKKTTAAPSPGVDIRPKLYVLSIGVSKYQHADMGQLDYADDDAREFAALLQKQKGSSSSLYSDVQTKVLLDGTATKESILDGLEWLEQETTSHDVAMLFFAGHGVDDRNGNFYYLPATADPAALKRTGVAHGDVQTTVASVSGKIIVFMDACHSGSLMRPIGTARGEMLPEIAPVVNELISAENGAVVFCSTTNRQKALEDAAWGHGAFTKALLEGLGGKAFSPGTKKITVKTLDAYVAERVKELTGRQQTPTTAYPPNVPDFPVSYGN